MEDSKFDIIQLVMQPYVLDILHLLDEPKRFNDLRTCVKNGRTLSLKLTQLLKYGLIEKSPLKNEKGSYVNSYIISKKGREFVKKLEKI